MADLGFLAYLVLTGTVVVFSCALCKFCQIRQEIHEQQQEQQGQHVLLDIDYVPLPSAPPFDENPTIQ
jgi:hypothetical protein